MSTKVIVAAILLLAGTIVCLVVALSRSAETAAGGDVRWLNGTMSGINVYHDDVRHVTCWGSREAVSCLPDVSFEPQKPQQGQHLVLHGRDTWGTNRSGRRRHRRGLSGLVMTPERFAELDAEVDEAIEAMADAAHSDALDAFAEEYKRELADLETSMGLPTLEWVLSQPDLVQREGVWCEFGVFLGGSLRLLDKHRGKAALWGFDSFRGLPEDWLPDHPKGHFAVGTHVALPPDGVNLVVGWYKDTVAAFRPDEPVTFALVDCDLYSSASDVFPYLFALTGPGSVIVIDDFFVKPYDRGVLRAFSEYVWDCGPGLRYEWLAKSHEQVALRVLA